MKAIHEKILLYFDLSIDEQAQVEQQIREDPELAALFAESRALHAILNVASDDAISSESSLVDYVLSSAMQAGNPPDHLAERYARIEAAIRENPALKVQVDAIRSSIQRLTEDAEDPIARFERLTARGQDLSFKPAEDREAIARRQGMRLLRPVRLALAASVALVAVYGVLSIVSRQLESERARMAGLENANDAFENLTFRGSPAEPESDELAEALIILRDARTSMLGLFASYNVERLDAAGELAERVAARGDMAASRRIQAHLILGKIRLYQGRDEEAAQALQFVVDSQVSGAEEARRLIDFINTQQPETNE